MSARDTAWTGTGTLLRAALRRDRVMAAVWVYALTASVAGTAVSLRRLYPTPAARASFARTVATDGTLRALYGPVLDPATTGGLTAWRMGSLGAALAGLMGVLIVVRHTRDEEESGRLELLAAGAVGRYAPLTAALLAGCAAAGALAVAVFAALVALGQGAAGSLALGGALGGAAVMFAAVAAVAAQLARGGRLARGVGGAVLGAAFLLRVAGDARGDALGWWSPLGWTAYARPFAAERWWLFAAMAAFAGVLTAVAFRLAARRDLGAGLLGDRPGAPVAGRWLRGPLGLAWRLHRGALAGWTVAFAVTGALAGGAASGAAGLIEGNARVGDLIRALGGTRRLDDAYLSAMTGLLGLVAAVQAVQAVLRIRAEETSGRAEPVLAGAVGRVRWALSHLAFAMAGPAVALAVGGVATGLAYGSGVPRLLAAALAEVPAVWVAGAVAALLAGAVPRAAQAAWAVPAGALLLGQLGPVLGAPRWAMDLSPFTHLPRLPSPVPVPPAPYLWLTLASLALTAASLTALRRRDVF
ncbi:MULTISPECIES: ABC transporter permease [Streptomycetaceae]|uniref:ABC transporter membrane-spanning protein n=1 Tax=Streptantibioticus cattleyicolor (strain ATCC 35852 / DSM 46488 / JCM 4925 / NBRC 14057 / NRRL 8057) TaxID=1003195 RepID=F8JVJ3_STREN|nr:MULTISPECIES: ABC transporter membrane-spanning protein [Streptomycetaceae]AEW95692.1 ABC transporter membrane-spanning protein [Streptantibioticus cattleyicolor NRRL 8057 = DSM 46488]MYS60238.1 ABC transporter permease [Streptomyces sp. SID5468]CCB76030.1 putative ABC transporter membrane-spanning protein [Streptantibioticus cattleyicolor NRRL 8057 = DSM 46488]